MPLAQCATDETLMQESTELLIDAVMKFQALLIERATSGGQTGDEQPFQSLRTTLLGSPLANA